MQHTTSVSPKKDFRDKDNRMSQLGGPGEECQITSAQNGNANRVSNLGFKMPLKGQLQFSHLKFFQISSQVRPWACMSLCLPPCQGLTEEPVLILTAWLLWSGGLSPPLSISTVPSARPQYNPPGPATSLGRGQCCAVAGARRRRKEVRATPRPMATGKVCSRG